MTVGPKISAVVIGRNEGSRLEESLQSVQTAGLPLVYVDSGSSDGSPAAARSLTIPVIELDPSRPFSAARARNEGLQEAQRLWPTIKYLLFLDGDCVLDRDFPSAAVDMLETHPDCAVVTGHLAEQFPDASIYNRLCAIEWRSPPGWIDEMNRLGGIMVVRIAAFQAVGGFDEQAIAGEEPDLGVRLGLAGFSMVKLDRPMAVHDARILRFKHWWTRAVRGGHATAHRYIRHGRTKYRDCEREFRSALFWGFMLPIVILLLLWPTRGLSLLLLFGYAVLGWRVYRHYYRTGVRRSDALIAARYIVLAKFAAFLGIVRYATHRLSGTFHIIEYK